MYLLPASTSPPRMRVELPMPVCTTEQYCSMLSTTCWSRLSINSRETASHSSGISARVSNLYPVRSALFIAGLQLTPIAHHVLTETAGVGRPLALLLLLRILNRVIFLDESADQLPPEDGTRLTLFP
jgi:hypothetical protein